MIFQDHVLSADGISANPEKVDKIRDWLVPKNVKELHSFMALASYYCQFIYKFIHVVNSAQINVEKNTGRKK